MMHDGSSSPLMSLIMLGRYRVLRRIGMGGTGEVWLCEDPSLQRQVAIKTLPFHHHGDQEYVSQFLQGVRSAATLHHPHIVPIHDYGEQPLQVNNQSVSYIVMPYIARGSLASYIEQSVQAHRRQGYRADSSDSAIERQGIVTLKESLNFLRQAAQAIDYAHARGIIHQDIKPANMLLRDDNWLLLADFGITPLLLNLEQKTEADLVLGTPYYMAPEQIQGHPVSGSDNYSLAVIAYQLVTGRLPFQADDQRSIADQHITQAPLPPRSFNPVLSLEFERILLRGLAKQPDERFPSAQEFVAELQRALPDAAHRSSSLDALNGHVSNRTPATLSGDADSNNSPQQLLQAETIPAAGQHPTFTRRQVLLLGGAGLLAAGGLGTWYWATHRVVTKPVLPPAGPVPLILRGHEMPVCSLSWSPENNTLASGGSSDGIVCIWDVQMLSTTHKSATPAFNKLFDNEGDKFLSWSPKGDMLAIANSGPTTGQLFDTASLVVANAQLTSYAPGFSSALRAKDAYSIDAIDWTPNGTLLTLKNVSIGNNYQTVLSVWNMQSAKHTVQDFPLAFVNETTSSLPFGSPLAVAMAANPLRLAVNGAENSVYYYELTFSATGTPTLKKYSPLTFSQTSNGSASISRDGRFVAAIQDSFDKPVGITTWDTQNKNQQKLLALPANMNTGVYLTALAYDGSASNARIAGGVTDGTVYIWDYQRSASPVQVLTPPADTRAAVNMLAWSGDGHWLAAAYNDTLATVLVWKV